MASTLWNHFHNSVDNHNTFVGNNTESFTFKVFVIGYL